VPPRHPVTYQRYLNDGSVEVYTRSDGSATYPRRVFLTQVIDPQGNAVSLSYDSQLRLTALTDATGRQTTFSYGLGGSPLLVTAITDPFGRTASLTYDRSGRLSSITDVLGLTSSFTYDSSGLVNSMTTPYGATQFAYGQNSANLYRWLQITDPLGYNEREETLQPAPVAFSDNAVPQGVTTFNAYLNYRDSFHWDKHAYTAAGCTLSGGCSYNDARIRHFFHDASNINVESSVTEALQYPLESRIWYDYPGQSAPYAAGTYDRPSAIGRLLDNGSTQLKQFAYNGFGRITQAVDPVGRTTQFTYAANQVDLLTVAQNTGSGPAAIAQFTWNSKHRPLSYIDAAGQSWHYAYNAVGQLTSVTDPLGETTGYQYDSLGYLATIVNADGVTAASFTRDAFGRVATFTDSQGWTATYGYDAADRVVQITYPDGTADQYTWNNLDLAVFQDRLGRVWSYAHDGDRRLVAVTDPLGNETQFGYWENGRLASLTDPNGNTTSWGIDVEGRPTAKQYADGSSVGYTYENTTSRLKAVTDALGQTKQYAYAADDRVAGISYLNAVNPTPNVAFTWDGYFPRLAAMSDGSGTTQYSYFPPGVLGALRLQQEIGPIGAIAYGYDALGRIATRNVGGAGSETFQYDAIGRLAAHAAGLGQFALSYLGETGQLTQRQLVGGNVATSWLYFPNGLDRRLHVVGNAGLRSYEIATTRENLATIINEQTCCVLLRRWDFGYDNANRLLSANASDAAAPYGYTLDPAGNITLFQSPIAANKTASYNNLNELTNLAGQPFAYDANGNLASDGQRNYSWDAENRLAVISYAAQPGKQTSFAYDGLGRRAAITTTVSGSAATTWYQWCGSRLCQAVNPNGAVARSYYDEGELVAASATQLYYGPNRLGSVRDVAVGGSSAAPQAYDYDPYGNPLQTIASGPLTDFRYAGMFYHADSGLYLTQYRAYDPRTARWLSRDPLPDRVALTNIRFGGPRQNLLPGLLLIGVNLYSYVLGNPANSTDLLGLLPNLGLPPGSLAGDPTDCPPGRGADEGGGDNQGVGGQGGASDPEGDANDLGLGGDQTGSSGDGGGSTPTVLRGGIVRSTKSRQVLVSGLLWKELRPPDGRGLGPLMTNPIKLRALFEEASRPEKFKDVHQELQAVSGDKKAMSVLSCSRSDLATHEIETIVTEALHHRLLVTYHAEKIPHGKSAYEQLYIFFTKPGQDWRIPAYIATRRILRDYRWSDGAEYLESHLLGYSETEISEWIAHKRYTRASWAGLTIYLLMPDATTERIRYLGMRCLEPASVGTDVIAFFSRSNLAVRSGAEGAIA
jgi:RHS repeat-associated protein